MKKYLFMATISILLIFASCENKGSKKERQIISSESLLGSYGGNTEIITYEDSIKMKRYTIFVKYSAYGIGCTLIDTEDMTCQH